MQKKIVIHEKNMREFNMNSNLIWIFFLMQKGFLTSTRRTYDECVMDGWREAWWLCGYDMMNGGCIHDEFVMGVFLVKMKYASHRMCFEREYIFRNFNHPMREWVKWVSELVNGMSDRSVQSATCYRASEWSDNSKADRCGATEGAFLVRDNRVLNGPLGLSLRSFVRTAHSAHSLTPSWDG